MQLQKSAGNQAVLQMMQAGGAPPVIQRQEGADNLKLKSDLETFKSRCAKYPDALAAAFVATFEEYVACLGAGDKDKGMPLLKKVLSHLQQVKAFSIPAKVYDQVEDKDAAADKYTSNVNLWSKTNKHMPGEKSEENEGITLESSLAGILFDGLSFGIDYSTSDLLKAQWKDVSTNFVSNAKGTVTAHILLGVNKKSVMYDTEAGIISEKLKKGEVQRVVVHYYKAKLGESDVELEEYKKEEVTTEEDWKKLLETTTNKVPLGEIKTKTGIKKVVANINANGSVFYGIQNFAHAAEERRHEAK